MKLEKEKIFVFYKRLISLYPREFRAPFGESMEQTFNDVCREQTKLKGKISLTFVFSTFAETSSGIVKENISALKGAYLMNYWLKNIGIAAFFSLLFTGVLFALAPFSDNPEIQSGNSTFPFLDFLRSWLILALILTPIVSGLRDGENMSMRNWLFPLSASIFFGLLLTAPFAFMEYWNNPRIQSGEFRFPFTLFYGLWLLPVIFFLAAAPILRGMRAGESVLAHPVSLLLRVVFLALLAIIWLNLIRDQMPCFLGGVPGCD